MDSSVTEIQAQIATVCSQDAGIRLIKKQQQTYFGSVRNFGIKEAQGEIIALIDTDCVADEHWLENIAKHMQDNLILSGITLNGTPHNAFGACSYLVHFLRYTLIISLECWVYTGAKKEFEEL